MNVDLMAMLKKSMDTVSLEQVLNFSRQFQLLLSSGMPVVQGLELLSEQSSGSFKTVILDIREKVSSGSFLWEAFSAYPKIFPKLFVSLIRAGEASGSLDQMFKRLCRYMEDADRIRRMVKGAMVYPLIVISIGFGVAGMMVVFVIPKFEEMLKGTGKELPGPTKFLIDLSHFMIGHLYPIIIGSSVTIYVLRRYLSSDEGRAFMDRAVFKMPIFGPLAQKSGIARFTRTLQTLMISGVSLLDALDICKSTIDNVVLEAAMAKIRTEVEGGKTLGMVIAKIPVFPKMASQMISVGESTGNMDKMLEKVADMYESEVENLAGGLGKAIEPFIVVFLGAMVGGIMIAMYLPVFQMGGGAD
jgi:type IV pilus assembly protein PilC